MRTSISSVALFSALALGCVSSLTPSIFQVSPDKGNLDVVQRAVIISGATIEIADPQLGVVQTAWESTGSNTDGTMWVHRFTVSASSGASTTEMRVDMDLRTCDPGQGTTRPDGSLDANLCPRVPGAIPRSYQTRLDDFATLLRDTLSR